VILWIVAAVALAFAMALVGFVARSAPPLRAGRDAIKLLPSAPPGGESARAELASFVPTLGAIVGALPRVDTRALLTELPAEGAVAVDLSLVGVHDDRDAADRELWRNARKALATKSDAS
jgi:hypothetical protein